jgi:hypothetical protein
MYFLKWKNNWKIESSLLFFGQMYVYIIEISLKIFFFWSQLIDGAFLIGLANFSSIFCFYFYMTSNYELLKLFFFNLGPSYKS